MRYLLILVALFGIGCGQAPNQVHPEIQPYYQSFINSGITEGVNVSNYEIEITFIDSANNPGRAAGFCRGRSKVYIDQEFWNRSTNAVKENLIFHELGHCILDRDHIDNAKSIMAPLTPTSDEQIKEREKRVHELFHPGDFRD